MKTKTSNRLMIILAIFLLDSVNIPGFGLDLSRLNKHDKDQLAEFLRMKKQFGSYIWPGFGEARIPLIQYNEQYEFLIGHPDPPSQWTPVENDEFQGNPYHRRDSADPQAFAVPVGDLWAGSLDTIGSMKQSMKEQLQERIPPEKLTPAMIKMMEITPAQHIAALLHEAFHAYIATEEPDRFLRAQKMYAIENLYPFEDDAFRSAWNEEGSALLSAVKEKDQAARLESIAKFLKIRAKRRSEASLSEELVAFERELEWLEGLAKYVEMQFAEKGSSLKEQAKSKDYLIFRNRSQADFSFRIRRLGDMDGDLRFYLSGAAQAMILDKVSPGWKKTTMGKNHIGLEDLLATALK